MLYLFTLGATLGLSAGFAPGPLLALVISETLQHGLKSGMKVALAPVVTDLPIIALAVFAMGTISGFQQAQGAISLFGALFVLFLGWQSLFPKKIDLPRPAPRSFGKGISVNALSPHPYLFWFGVGAPTLLNAFDQGPWPTLAFIGPFYLLLVGSKLLVACIVSKSRSFLSGAVYTLVMKSLGITLIIFSLFLFRDSLVLLGIINNPWKITNSYFRNTSIITAISLAATC